MVQLHHVALGAEDVRLVAEFYSQAFDLPTVKEHLYDDGALRSIWLKTGDTLLMIEHVADERASEPDGEHPRWVRHLGRGPFLLAFSVSPSEAFEVEERLISLGAVIESRTEHSAYARDPEGNRIAISHFPLD